MNFLREFFLDDLGLKVTSLLLAFLLWFQIAGQATIQRTVTVPVEFRNLPPRFVISNDYTRFVDVTISRPATQRNSDSGLAVVVDMSDSQTGREDVQLTTRNVEAPFGVEVEAINPNRIRLELETVVRKLVAIEAETVGQPADGYELTEVQLTPSEVLVSGPESRVDALVGAETAPIDINGKSEPFRTRFFIDLADPMLQIDTTPRNEAFVIIEERRKPVQLGSFRVTLQPTNQGARLSPRSVRVTGSVPLSFDGTLEATLFSVTVSFPEAGPPEPGTSMDLTPEVVIPEQYQSVFRVVRVEPEVVSVTLR